ncbi:MAG: HTH domain-containing protein [Clostridia bacterium]
MKTNRLFGIIYLLLSKNTMTAKELAEYFEVSTRTIYRDIELLSELNIPIYMSKGKNGGISLLENYKFDKSLLTNEEQNQILFHYKE